MRCLQFDLQLIHWNLETKSCEGVLKIYGKLLIFAYFSNARERDASMVLNAEFRTFINPVDKTKLSCSPFL